MDAAVILVLAGPILIPVALIVFVPLTIRAERERRRILRQWATQHGWTFADSSRARWVSRMPRGGRYLGVTLTGQIGGHWVTVAAYAYKTETVAATVGPRSASIAPLVHVADRLARTRPSNGLHQDQVEMMAGASRPMPP